MKYQRMPAPQRRTWLMQLAREDEFFAPLIDVLQQLGADIEFPLFGQTGGYQPHAVFIVQGSTPEDEAAALRKAVQDGAMRCHFTFPRRYGRSYSAHYWLHELAHFYQDMHGLLLTPKERENKMPVMPDARSAVRTLLFCEAMATTEAIRASWRLKQKGIPEAWRGAVLSPDWFGLARRYKSLLKTGMAEPQAAADIFQRWYKGRHRPHYERRALENWHDSILKYMKNAGITDRADILPYLRSVRLPELAAMLPAPEYLSALNLGSSPFNKLRSKQLEMLEHHFGKADNENIADIEPGSVPYLLIKT